MLVKLGAGGEKLHVMMGRRSKCQNARITVESREKGAVEEGISRVWRDLACLSKPRRLHIHCMWLGGNSACSSWEDMDRESLAGLWPV